VLVEGVTIAKNYPMKSVLAVNPIPRCEMEGVFIGFLFSLPPICGILIKNIITEWEPIGSSTDMSDKKTSTDVFLQEAREADPEHLVGMAYDLAILACEREDASQSIQTIRLLREAMHSIGPADSADLLQFYDWCMGRIRGGEFQIAAQTLSTLRNAWEKIH
jgi:hypothetical protein